MFTFSARSERNLSGVHADLVAVVRRALELTTVDFGVTEGLRSQERQRALVAAGKSQTLNSRHLTGHAVDVMAYTNGHGTWEWRCYEQINTAFQAAAQELGVAVEWGGHWRTLRDGAHFQLSWQAYP